MTKGVLIFALNNKQVDYIKIALYAAENVKRHLNCHVTLVIDSKSWLESQYPTYSSVVDNVITVVNSPTDKADEFYFNVTTQYRTYRDGVDAQRLEFKNDIRVHVYEISPYDETLVIDCDYIVCNDSLKHCWDQSHDFLIYESAQDLSYYRHDPRLITVSETSVNFYWATVFFFRKNKNTKTFFNLLKHIEENWNFYRYLYQISYALYRNDYAFCIAIHIMNGLQQGDWAVALPGTLYYVTDRDHLIKKENTSMTFLVEKENHQGQYTLLKTSDLNVHVMNKFSILRIMDNNNE
jgi:hypothetical protein